MLGIKKVLGLHPLTGIVVGIKFRNLVEIKTQKKAKILFGNYKKGFYICTPQTIKVVNGKVQNILREIFQKKIKFLFGD